MIKTAVPVRQSDAGSDRAAGLAGEPDTAIIVDQVCKAGAGPVPGKRRMYYQMPDIPRGARGRGRSSAGLRAGMALLLTLGLCWGASVLQAQPQPEVLLQAASGDAAQRPDFSGAARADERRRMVAQQIAGRSVRDEAVLSAMRRVPRHEFVPADARARAYADSPQPIGHGQTISQPYIVAFMTEKLALEPGDRVLEVGTGSAYQAAILAEIVDEVVSLEIIEPLARSAANRLERLGYGNVTVLHGDGYHGYPDRAPYDAIIVTAAASHVPPPLIEQLDPGGRMAIPVGQGWTQNLLLVEKNEQGETTTRNLMAVRFVPLTGDH